MLKFSGEEEVYSSFTFMITKCRDTTIVIQGKCKNIVMNECFNVKVVFDSVLATFEIINGKKITVQVQEQLPYLTIEKSESVNVYLQDPAKGVEIHSTCS